MWGLKTEWFLTPPKFWREPNLQKGMHASCCQRYASRGKRESATCLVIRHRHNVTQACKRKKKNKNKNKKEKEKEKSSKLLIFGVVFSHLFIDGHVAWKDRAIFPE